MGKKGDLKMSQNFEDFYLKGLSVGNWGNYPYLCGTNNGLHCKIII